MSSTSRAWIAAATVGVVEGLKDQGLCRLNYTLRSVEKNLGSISQSKRFSSLCSRPAVSKSVDREERLQQSEESLRKVMYLSCWGPN
ncbi:hypothetical protein AQUCO_00200820v1 [Aquilegia coerulea]|uniref:Wound-responsive family protein n=1 Tax=Aquilegia coerulea TaxID=218851 RepID=A0A2G5F4V9_AQUCA|nr:hypothetical protein AQUCO_00200820v1 [Aquilegia coerulea]